LPHCPTYGVDNDETESPRGRVSIVLALASNTLSKAEASEALSRCLLCRACHASCPAGVRPAKLVQLVRQQTPIPPTPISRMVHWITNSHRLTALAAYGLALYQSSGLQQWLREKDRLETFMPALAKLESLLPEARPKDPIPDFPAETSTDKPRVALLCSCMARLFHPRTGPATANLLALTGANVTVWQGFGCCGAPFRESGNRPAFLRQAKRTLDAFLAAGSVDTVLCDSALCAVTVRSYARALANDPDYAAPAKELAAKTEDLTVYLTKHLLSQPVTFGPMNFIRMTYQDHCQTRFGLGIIKEPRKLVDALPVEHLEQTSVSCCGAGGEYMLRYPQRSQAIRAAKIEALIASGVDCVAASNPGCLLHLEAGLRHTGSKIQVRHLAELLWTSLNSSTASTRK
ncbi:MAG: (Fe-S)-binding protein, partial [Magnetococcales bacterium]|nr:(Fe-S)-binding protein [Magnetococcales bacterium]